jgi:hypothetical protein
MLRRPYRGLLHERKIGSSEATRLLEIIGRSDPALLIAEVTSQEKPMSTP